MRKLFLILTMISACAQDIFVPFFSATSTTGNNLNTSLYAYWQFDTTAGGVPNAAGVTSRDLIVPAGAVAPSSTTSPIIGNARSFDQTDITPPNSGHYPNGQYFASSDPTQFNFLSSDFTVAAWVNFPFNTSGDHLGHKTVIGKGDFGPGRLCWWLVMERNSSADPADDYFAFYVSGDGSTITTIATTPLNIIYENGHYWLVVVTKSGSAISIRARADNSPTNGSQDITGAGTFAGSLFSNVIDPVVIATQRGFSNNIYDMWGDVDSIGIWTRVLDYPCQYNKLFAQFSSHAPTYAQFDTNPCAP